MLDTSLELIFFRYVFGPFSLRRFIVVVVVMEEIQEKKGAYLSWRSMTHFSCHLAIISSFTWFVLNFRSSVSSSLWLARWDAAGTQHTLLTCRDTSFSHATQTQTNSKWIFTFPFRGVVDNRPVVVERSGRKDLIMLSRSVNLIIFKRPRRNSDVMNVFCSLKPSFLSTGRGATTNNNKIVDLRMIKWHEFPISTARYNCMVGLLLSLINRAGWLGSVLDSNARNPMKEWKTNRESRIIAEW